MLQKYGKLIIFAMMTTLLALDSFKGCLSAREAVEAAAAALQGQETVRLPLSDGGEGFTDCIVSALGGHFRKVRVHDPLGRPLDASYGLVRSGGVAVIETAAAGGITLLKPSELDPWNASSYGIGEMMKDAVSQGVEEIWIGLGGTAVMDGGTGLLEALGPLPANLRIQAFFDADVPLTGPVGAAFVFGPQKGADAGMVRKLDARFRQLAGQWKRQYGIGADTVPGAGAAGGIGAALGVCLGAEMHSGISAVLQAAGFRNLLPASGLVITGEGKADRQTLAGKAPYGVLRAVKEVAPDLPVVLVAGLVEDRDALLAAGFDEVVQATPEQDLSGNYLDPSVARENLRRAVRRVAQDFQQLGNEH